MTDLRKAAKMALEYFEGAYGLEDMEIEIKEALRQALAQPEQEPVKLSWADIGVTSLPFSPLEKEPVAWVQPNGEIVVRADYGGRLYYSEQNVYTEQRIKQAVLAERDACAEWLRDNYQDYKNIADICEAIRTRGEK